MANIVTAPTEMLCLDGNLLSLDGQLFCLMDAYEIEIVDITDAEIIPNPATINTSAQISVAAEAETHYIPVDELEKIYSGEIFCGEVN